jgi:hypothetical protein
MKSLKSKPSIFILFTVIALAMSGCGKGGNDAVPPPGVPGAIGPYGQYNTAGGALGSACTPIQGPIPFQGSLYIDSANVVSGQAPVAAPGGYGTNPYGQGQITMSGSGSDGWMTIQAQMITATGANAAGQLQLSQLVIQQIMYQMSYGNPYGYGQPQQVPCAQIVAINLGHYNTTLYGGRVQIMINGSIPYIVYF